MVMAIGVGHDAFAFRFGLNTGLYNESINTPCARTREFGLRLGFYADRTVNDILYAQAVNGTNICGVGGCGVAPAALAPTPCGCGAAIADYHVAQPVGCGTVSMPGAIVPPGCGSTMVRPSCGCATAVAPAPTCGCAATAPVGCGASYAPVAQQVAAPTTKTEIYLLVLPDTRPAMSYQQPPMMQQQPQGYYREPAAYQQPVRGLW